MGQHLMDYSRICNMPGVPLLYTRRHAADVVQHLQYKWLPRLPDACCCANDAFRLDRTVSSVKLASGWPHCVHRNGRTCSCKQLECCRWTQACSSSRTIFDGFCSVSIRHSVRSCVKAAAGCYKACRQWCVIDSCCSYCCAAHVLLATLQGVTAFQWSVEQLR